MEDLERYSDYNETEEDENGGKRKHFSVFKFLFGIVAVLVIGVLAFRLILAEYYPKEMRRILVTPTIEAAGEDAAFYTQKLRFYYDDAKEGTFFCDHLIFCPESGDLQITVRYNESGLATIREKTGKESFTLTFALSDNTALDETVDTRTYASPVAQKQDTLLMYTYEKLAFSGVPLTDTPADGLPAPEWIRLDVFVDGTYYSSVLIYENNEDYAVFDVYQPAKGELDL